MQVEVECGDLPLLDVAQALRVPREHLGIVPVFQTAMEGGSVVPCLPLLGAIARAGNFRGGELTWITDHPDSAFVPLQEPTDRSLEFVEYALGENWVEVAVALDRALDPVPRTIDLVGHECFVLESGRRESALAFVNAKLPKAKRLTSAAVGDATAVQSASARLLDQRQYQHEIVLQALVKSVGGESAPVLVVAPDRYFYVEDLWAIIQDRCEIVRRTTPSTGEAWFARAVAERGLSRASAPESFQRAVREGYTSAQRWLG
jgi:hypothetical protein